MSGNGLISVRLPRSLMTAFEASASRAGMDMHGAARQLIRHVEELSDDELISLPEPQREADNPRISLYVGLAQIETLTAASDRTQVSMSRIVRRLIYGLVAARSIRFRADETTHLVPHSMEDFELVAVVFALLAVAVIGTVLLYRWAKNRKQKHVTQGQKPKVGQTGSNREAEPQ